MENTNNPLRPPSENTFTAPAQNALDCNTPAYPQYEGQTGLDPTIEFTGEPTVIYSNEWTDPDQTEVIHPAATNNDQLIHPNDLELEKILREQNNYPVYEEVAPRVIDPDPQLCAPAVPPIVPPPAPDIPAPAVTEPQKAPKAPKAPKPPKKDKPAPKKHTKLKDKKRKDPFGLPQLGATVVWLALILMIGLSIGRTLWAACTDVFAFGKEELSTTITITSEDDIDDVAKMLYDAKLIRYPKLFKLFAELTGKDERISTGTFDLNSQLDYNAMINAMSDNAAGRKQVQIMFPEGSTCAQIFAKLEAEGVCKVEDIEKFLTATKSENEEIYNARAALQTDYWFLAGIELGDRYSLEGFLFPDTYNFYLDDDPERVLRKFLDTFDARFTDIMKEDFEAFQDRYAAALSARGYSAEYIVAHPMTFHKVVIIASMIEKETANDEESYNISSVIFNRLTNPGEYPYLNIDAALVYALDGKTELTEADKALDSPYNTYLYQGLIPGAISNPGTNSLMAALNPNDNRYLFYALNPKTGSHHFTTNYADHINFLNSLG